VEGKGQIDVRAVKQIRRAEEIQYIRELEAIAKFSQTKVTILDLSPAAMKLTFV
jgi:hypothetical protein